MGKKNTDEKAVSIEENVATARKIKKLQWLLIQRAGKLADLYGKITDDPFHSLGNDPLYEIGVIISDLKEAKRKAEKLKRKMFAKHNPA